MHSTDTAIFSSGIAAKMLDIHPRTLRIYEEAGLLTPARKGRWSAFTTNDLEWISCLREMVHTHGVSIPAIKKLLNYTPCWNSTDCPFEKRQHCSALLSNDLAPRKVSRIIPFKRHAADLAA